jgi:hypothetical protein
MTQRPAALCACAALLAACAAESTSIDPAPVAPSDAGPQTDSEASSDAAPEASLPTEAGPIKRRVLNRSPFGNLDRAGDLLMDPDFEFSTGRGQTAWVAVSDLGQQRLTIETGGTCRSGLRCVRIEGSTALLGEATGATNTGSTLSFWAKVPGDYCAVINAYFIRAMTYTIVPDAPITPSTDTPDDEGWCRFEGTAPKQKERLAIYIELKPSVFSLSAVLDDASLRPADGMSALAATSEPVDPDAQRRVRDRLGWLRRNRWYGTTVRERPHDGIGR